MFINTHSIVTLYKNWRSVTNYWLEIMTRNRTHVKLENIQVLNASYHCKKFRSKISESPFIKHNKSSLNKQQISVTLKLFNWFCFTLI